MSPFYRRPRIRQMFFSFVLGAAAAACAPALAAGDLRHRHDALGRYDVIHDFDSTSATGGDYPYGLAKASDGRIYGVTALVADVPDQFGAIYRLRSDGSTSIVTLTRHRASALIGARTGGALYYTVMLDDYVYEPDGCGELHRLEPDGHTPILFKFSHDSPLGCYLTPSLVEADDGSLIGSTQYEGGMGQGAIFRIALDGTGTLLHTYTGDSNHDPYHNLAVCLSQDGTVYAIGQVAIYRIDSDGAAVEVARFDQTTVGFIPPAGLIRGTDGGLYGTTGLGGPYNFGSVFRFDVATNAITVLHTFGADWRDAGNPSSGLLQASDGYLYGTTGSSRGSEGGVYRVRPDGSGYERLVRFQYQVDGYTNGAPLIETSDGQLLGGRYYGGLYGSGSVYKLRPRAGSAAEH